MKIQDSYFFFLLYLFLKTYHGRKVLSLFLTAQLNNMTMTGGQGSMLHLQSSMQHSPLGINVINTHSGSVSFNGLVRRSTFILYESRLNLMLNVPGPIPQMSPFSMNGLPSPGYQCPTSVYQPTPQQVYPLTQPGQQVPYTS